MTIADPDVSVESTVARETASSSAKKALSSPWASLAAVVIAVMNVYLLYQTFAGA